MERERDRERRLGSRRDSKNGDSLPYGGSGDERKRRTSVVDDEGDTEMGDKRERKIARLDSKEAKVSYIFLSVSYVTFTESL